MKRQFILTGDLHLRSTVPINRVDDFLAAQERKLKAIRDLQARLGGCSVLDAGDVFHSWKADNYVAMLAMKSLPSPMYTVAGNHDLPNHSAALGAEKSMLAIWAEATGNSAAFGNYLYGGLYDRGILFTPFGFSPPEKLTCRPKPSILVTHTPVFEHSVPPFLEGRTAEEMLDAFPDFDLIVTGHIHEPFAVERDGRWIVNPGSMMRASIQEKDHAPRVYIWTEGEGVDPFFLPIEPGEKVFGTPKATGDKAEKDARMEAFLERLRGRYEIGVSFVENLERYMKEHRVRPTVEEIIRECAGSQG